MDAVIKVGGSLAEQPEALKSLCVELHRLGLKCSMVVVPGGGKFADAVRDFDRTYGLSPALAHRMAILAMDQYGLALSQLIPNAAVCDVLEDTRRLSEAKRIAVFLPSKLMFQAEPLEACWDVTSDSLAAYIAQRLQANKLILVTDVDGIFAKDPKKHLDAKLLHEVSAEQLSKLDERTSVDKFLPSLLLQNSLDCYVVNGKSPERVGRILFGKQTICTRIV